MKTTNYDISVDAADLIADDDGHEDAVFDADVDDFDDAGATASAVALAEAAPRTTASGDRGETTARRHPAVNNNARRFPGHHVVANDDDSNHDDDVDDTVPTSTAPAERRGHAPPPPDLSILDEDDIGWVARLIDIVVASQGQPWRVALERIDGAQYLDESIPHHQFVAAVGALQRVLGGRGLKAQLARACRELVLGHPALTNSTRADRVAAAARALDMSCQDVERLLWADLPRERPVELPFGRPSELEVAAFANVQLIQRAVRRAHTISIAVRGDAGLLIRGAATRGLLATVGVATDDDDVTILDIVGPLTLCHRTAVYGRAIASLVPLLAECSAFELTLSAMGAAGAYRTRLASPILLPSLPARAITSSAIANRLARDLRRVIPGHEIVVGPPPILVGDTFVCPDIAIDRGRRYVEIVGFWTTPYLERKRAAYARAGLDVLICVDEARSCADEVLPDNVIAFTKHVDAAAVVGGLPMGSGDASRKGLTSRGR